jgi:hypothetical protein
MSSTIAAKTEDRQQNTTVNIETTQQDATGSTSSMSVFYQVRLVKKCRS